MNIVFYDFEVFVEDWMVVIIDYQTREKFDVINDKNKLQQIYEKYKNDIWVGYNSRNYDQFILKGILLGLDPYKITQDLIVENKKGYQIIQKHAEVPINNFDISTGFHSLKQLEGFMGSKIQESSVDFSISRKLTHDEVLEVLDYCTHDVTETIKVFELRREEFDSQLAMLEAFSLPMEMFTKTKAQLSAEVLGATERKSFDDEFNLRFPDTLVLSEKYQYILDWYKNEKNRSYDKQLFTDVANVPHVFAWGGIHGAISNYTASGIILCCDVASLYPSIMIEYGYISRNVVNPSKYREIRDTRLRLKAEKNPMQQPLKIVLNSTYGAMKDKHNNLYDPLMANNVCIAGQLLLLDLIEKIEPYCELIQSNTDGLFMKVNSEDDIEVIKFIASEWERRTRLDLEWEIFDNIFQKDVNNYIISKQSGEYKSKGAYVKKLNKIDYDLPIVNKALINYFTKGVPVENTINDCEDLIEFQKVVKITNLYKYALHGENKIKEKVIRVFASKDESAPAIVKVKGVDRIEKIANTPDNCFICNDYILNAKIPKELDKQYYVQVAEKRLNDFMSKDKKSPKQKSSIKYVSAEVKSQFETLLESDESSTFIEFITESAANIEYNSRQLDVLIKLNYFNKFGEINYLLKIVDMLKWMDKTQISKDKVDDCPFTEQDILKASTKVTHKKYVGVNFKSLVYDYCDKLEFTPTKISDLINYSVEFTGAISVELNVDPRFVYVVEISGQKFTPKLKLYSLGNGKVLEMKIPKESCKDIKVGDILYLHKVKQKPRWMPDGKHANGKPKFTMHPTDKEWWIENYERKTEYELTNSGN